MKHTHLLGWAAVLALLSLSACTDRQARRPVGPAPAMNAPVPEAPQSQATFPVSDAASGEVMLNPEHGMPGHRCEIPVGAPLNSSPSDMGAAAGAAPTTAGPRIEAQPAAPKQRLNPPHGEPGHDCNVPVGEPLP